MTLRQRSLPAVALLVALFAGTIAAGQGTAEGGTADGGTADGTADLAGSGFSIEVHLVVEGPEGSRSPLQGKLLALPPSGSKAEPVSIGLSMSRSLNLDLPAEGIWTLQLEAEGHWSSDALAWPGREEVVLHLFPTGVLSGEARKPAGSELPETLRVRFTPAGELRRIKPDSTSPRHGSVDCPFDQEGRWRCEIPAGEADLHLHAEGFASVFRFEVSIEAGGREDLGTILLQPGASIVGSIDLGSARGAESPVRIRLSPAGRAGPLGPHHGQLDLLSQTLEPDEQGFFQFRDLRPGVYRVEATADGLAPAVVERLEVQEGQESRILSPLQLAPLARAEIHIEPPLRPDGGRWNVRLTQPKISTQEVQGTVDATGTWRHDDLSPGLYLVRVEGMHRTEWHEQYHEIELGSPPIEVRLPVIEIEGRLTIDGEPMRSLLLFERPAGGEVIKLVSDLDDGSFSGHLPQPGEWRISYLGRLKEKHVLDQVRIERREDGEPTWLDLELPETRLEGRVVDGAGRPVRGARVSATPTHDDRPPGTSLAETDGDGEFFFRGLQEGEYVVNVVTSRGSARKDVEVSKAADTSIEIRLRANVSLHGRLLGADGRPVVGAHVYAYPRLPIPRQVPLVQQITGLEGEFEIAVAFDARELDVLILPPGYAARLFRIPFNPRLPSEPPAIFTVDTVGGTLHLRPGGSYRDALGTTLRSGGAEMFFRPLERWAQLHGSSPRPSDGWRLPQFAPGRYALCSRGGAPCSEGELTPGSVLVLEPPAPAASDEESAETR